MHRRYEVSAPALDPEYCKIVTADTASAAKGLAALDFLGAASGPGKVYKRLQCRLIPDAVDHCPNCKHIRPLTRHAADPALPALCRYCRSAISRNAKWAPARAAKRAALEARYAEAEQAGL